MSRELSGNVRPTRKSAFVVGNGPSLKEFDFSRLKDASWVGMNAAYRHWSETGVYPTYYACLDLIVGRSHQQEIERLVDQAKSLGIKAFLLRNDLIAKSEVLSKSPLVQNYDIIFESLPERVFELVTTGSHAALWMEKLGFKKIILLGIDANYEEKVPGSKALNDTELQINARAKNPNYYFEGYQREGDRYTVPNPLAGVHFGAWRRCAQYLDAKGSKARIYNASAISEIDSFPFISILDLFDGGSKSISPEEQFDRKESRCLEVERDGAPFCLTAFLESLCPPHVACFDILGKSAPNISRLKKYGWSQPSRNRKDLKRTVLSFSESVPDEVAVGVTSFRTREQAKLVCAKLLKSNDTVLILSENLERIVVRIYPCFIEIETGYVIAFRSTRFWRWELKRALVFAVSNVPPRPISKKKFNRKIRATLSKFRSQ